ncbi:MAG TPA: HAD-IB family phosphatase [Nitrososphaerales archaeon]|nr:HAD-IB family phosphatase [Nitrososphaerales archaeon]
MAARPTSLLCDFDGTVTAIDTGVLILDRFAKGDWRTLDELYDLGRATIEEVLSRQFAMVRAEKRAILNEIDAKVYLRRGFNQLVRFCTRAGIPLTIVSYGLDFCIESILGRAGLRGQVELCSPRSKVTPEGIVFTYPKRLASGSVNMKDDILLGYRESGYRVVFVGDGASDLPAARKADECFVVRGSKLEELCRREGVRCTSVLSFDPVERSLRRELRAGDDR